MLDRATATLPLLLVLAAGCIGDDDDAQRTFAQLPCDIQDADCQDAVYRATAEVAQMPAEDRPPVRRISVGELEDVLREKSELEPDEAEAEHSYSVALQLLGLLPEGQSAQDAAIEQGVAQIAAYYDAEEKLVSVVARGARGAASRDLFVLSHELAHALRDAQSDLRGFREQYATSSDSAAATSALIEGEAMVVGAAVVARAAQGADYVVDWTEFADDLDDATLDVIAAAPAPLVAAVEQLPYAYGARRLGRDWDADGRSAVDAFYEKPVLTLQGWSQRRPLRADLDPLDCFPTAPPPGYVGYDSDTLGIAGLIALPIALATTDVSDAVALSDGWRDDRLVIFRAGTDPDAAHAVAWRVRFATPREASEFADAIGCCLPEGAQRTLIDRDLLIVAASDPAALAAWTDAGACGQAQDVPKVDHAPSERRTGGGDSAHAAAGDSARAAAGGDARTPAVWRAWGARAGVIGILNRAQIPMASGPAGR